MTKVFEGDVLHIIPADNRIIVAYAEEREATQMTVAFKMIPFDNTESTNVAKNIYQLSKFGANYRSFCIQVQNYFTCKNIILKSEKMLVLEQDGTVELLDTDASFLWAGKLLYKNSSPSSIAIFESKLWATFPEHNVLVRYNINTMREELRIGGGVSSPFANPCDIFVKDNFAYISNPGSLQILKVDLNTYSLEVFEEFTAPVKQYLEIENHRFAVMDDGVYKLD
ncbi:MAG: hypothetical protein E7568_00130 [Ruminococcaceae bacterium]|nr:hypothetical protein [Oscillospiraceae bacterium]